MPQYQVALILSPPGWQPAGLDDVPPQLGEPVDFLETVDDLFCALGQAAQYNEKADGEHSRRWAVVCDPDGPSRIWSHARLCTPLRYQVNVIWWPEGWEPTGPLDVPNCVWRARGDETGESVSYPKAEATVQALNRQCIDAPETTWHVVAAVENEPISRTVSYDPTGTESTVEVRRMHVIRPDRGSTGDCSHCPAHDLSCARAEWQSMMQTASTRLTRSLKP